MKRLIFTIVFIAVTNSYHLQPRELPSVQKKYSNLSSNILASQHNSEKSFPKQSIESLFSEYGSKYLPLRDAVEAPPDIIKSQDIKWGAFNISRQKNERVPLRDAVEHRAEPNFDTSFDHEAVWIERISPPTVYETESELKIVCHLEARAVYRMDPFSLLPQAIPIQKCTHLIYNSASVDFDKMEVIVRDPDYDEVKGGYKTALELRQRDPGLRVLISINPSDNKIIDKDLFADSNRTQQLVISVLNFVKKYDFDGVEIDWENRSNVEFKTLLRKLYPSLIKEGYILALAIRPEDTVDPEIAMFTDFLFFKAWRNADNQKFTYHSAPLKFVSSFVDNWISRGVEHHKIVLGIPLFGKSFTLKFSNSTSVGSPITGPGLAATYTNQSGFMSYYEICENLGNMWIYGRDEEGPYLKRGDQWIGYDDPISVKIKSAYVKSTGLGGISLWSLDLDDFQGICGNPWPILNTVLKALNHHDIPTEKCSKSGLFSDPDNCSGYVSCDKGFLYHGSCGYGRFYNSEYGKCIKAKPEICEPGYSYRASSITSRLKELHNKQQLEHLELRENDKIIVCYVTSWASYRKGEGKFVPEHIDARLCTHIIYAFAGLNPETLLINPFDPWADIENSLYHRITSVKGPSVMLALGGWTDSSGNKYSRLVNNGSNRRKFAASTVNFLVKHNFNGLSLEWNYPVCWQSNCRKGSESDKPNFTNLLKELRKEFNKQEPPLILSVSLSGYKEVIDKAYQIHDISKLVDFMTVMTYDYHGSWESKTDHLAPLYSETSDANQHYSVNSTMQYLVRLGALKKKLLVGIPMYGQSYRLSSASHSKLGDPTIGPGTPGEHTRQPGMLAYYEICERLEKQNWKLESDPYAYFKDQWVSFEDSNSIMKKGEYILENGFGGATAWTVDLDDFTNRCCKEPFPLLRSLNRALGRLLTPIQFEKDCKKPFEPVTPQPPTLTTHSDAFDGRPQSTKHMDASTTVKITTWPTWTENPFLTTKQTTLYVTSRRTTVRKTTVINPTTTVKDTIPTTVTTKPDVQCNSGEYAPDPENCGSYFRCILGEMKREQCAPGLHWDVNRGLCDWPSSAKCQQGNLSTSTTRKSATDETTNFDETSQTETHRMSTTCQTTTIKSTSKPVITKPTKKPGKQCQHGQYYSHPNSCSQFLICVNGDLIAQQCGPGLNWNDEKNMCDWAFVKPCNQDYNKKAPFRKKDIDEKNCTPGSYSSVPGDCESYRACLWGRHEIFQCAPGLHFNAETHICDWPARAMCQDENIAPDYIPVTAVNPSTVTFKPVITTENLFTWTEQPSKPSSTPAIDPEKKSPLSGYFKVVCYFTNWAWYRRGIGRYLPEHIDHTLCTHIIYGFAVLDYSELTIKAHDSWADFDNQFYERVIAYKKRGLKVSLALGGWNDSAGDKYSRLVNNPSARKKFVEHTIKFIEKFGFDGLDLDWEYPVCWQVDCKKGPASDKQGFVSLIEELNREMKPKGLLLTAAVSPSKTVVDKSYDVPALAKHLDWIAVMTYDFHGQWDKKTGHVAPLYYHEDDEFYYFNANYSIHYWISKGAPPRSIVMGMPLYGQSFSINDPKAGTKLNVPASAGNAGEFTRAAGFLAYYEICDRIINRGWTVVQDPQRRMGPYAYKGNQWVSFDDSDMIRQKAQFIRDMGLGGGMVWALDLDDFKGKCRERSYPLMHTLQKVLADPPNEHDKPTQSSEFIQELEWETPMFAVGDVPSKSSIPVDLKTDNDEKDEFKMICYFTNWAWYRQEGGKYLPEDIDPDLCTHIIYGFAVLDSSTLTIKSHDPWADIDNKFYERIVAFRSKGKKVLVAIGGWNDSQGDKYSRLVNSADSRKKFISHVVQFIQKFNFDGLDLDWEYPVCWQVDCKKGPKSDKESFTNFVKELSETFRLRGFLLSAAVSPSKRIINEGYNVAEIAKYFDWISVMTYDYHGQWDKKTGHVAPLFGLPDDWEPTFNTNFSIYYWMEQGAPAKKLVMGVPLYGQSFSLAERNQRGLNAPTYGGGEAGEATRARGFLSYYEICQRTLKLGWTVVQDPKRRIGPYAFHGDQWISFDDAKQIKLKAELIKELGLGGGMVWALDLDDFKNRCDCESYPLLKTLNRVLRNYTAGPLCTVTGSSTESFSSTTTEKSTSGINEINTVNIISSTTEDISDVEDTPKVTVETPTTVAASVTECGEQLFMAHKDDCSKYFLCNFGYFSEQSCPDGLLWNNDRCDWPENTKCHRKQETDN